MLRAQSVSKQDQLHKATNEPACSNLPLLEKHVEDMKTRLRDWPELSRDADANKQLEQPAPGE
jgi:hypothetical protein